MIDIHAHILAGMDDGPERLEESVEMARMAAADGTSVMIATPHTCDGVYNSRKADVLNSCRVLNAVLEQEGIALAILPGQEIRLTPELLELIDDDTVLTLNCSDHILIELPNFFIGDMIPSIIKGIVQRDLVPVITHPERSMQLMTQPDLMEEILYLGARFQVTAGSLTGVFGRDVKKCATALVKKGHVHFIGSDGHGVTRRQPVMAKGMARLKKLGSRILSHDTEAILNAKERLSIPA